MYVLIGVFMGGVIMFKFVFKYFELVDRIVVCDFNVVSFDVNIVVWKDCIVVVEKNIWDLVGVMVERWFYFYIMIEKFEIVKWMIDMVVGNNVEGFKYSC